MLVCLGKHCRYLGVRFGNCTAEQAFAPAIAKMKAKATFLKTLAPDDVEKASLFKLWIQPVVWLTARVYQPTKGVLASLNLVYRTALGLHSWTLSPAMVAAPLQEGGLNTNPSAVWCRFMFSQLWIIFARTAQSAGAVGPELSSMGKFHRAVVIASFPTIYAVGGCVRGKHLIFPTGLRYIL